MEKKILIGALTSKPYSFKARTWELENIKTIDLFDSLCSNIKIDIKGTNIMRILPINNKFINEYWISDKTRYAYDGLKRKRFINPMILRNKLFVECSWAQIWRELKKLLFFNKHDNTKNFIIKTGNYISIEEIVELQKLSYKINNWMPTIINDNIINADLQDYYLINLNTTLNVSKLSKKVLLIMNVDLKRQNPVLNIRLNKLNKLKNLLIINFGQIDGICSTININNINIMNTILKGKHPLCYKIQNFLKNNNKNIKIKRFFWNKISLLITESFTSYCILKKNFDIINQYIKVELNSLTSYSGIINAKELGFFNNYIATNSKKNIYYLLNVEVFNKKTSEDYVIFQGHHNNRDYLNFDMILPSTTWLEKSGSYLNCFGILQETQYCSLPSNNVKSDKKIMNRFFWLFKNFFMKENLNKKYKFFGHNSFEEYLDWCNIKKKVMLSNITTNNVLEFSNTHNYLNKKIFKNLPINFKSFDIKNKTKMIQNNMPIRLLIHNYYCINSIEKASNIMKTCDKNLNKFNNNFNK